MRRSQGPKDAINKQILKGEIHVKLVVPEGIPEGQTAAKIIAGLGGGQRLGAGAEGAVCSFLATLLRCAGEEEDR